MYIRITSTIEDLVIVAQSNYLARGDIYRPKHTMILVSGGPGIGKTRAGWESQHLVNHADNLGIEFKLISDSETKSFRDALKDLCYIYIDFSNRCKYFQQLDEKYDATVRMGTRIAVASGLVEESLDYFDKSFTVAKVIQKILELRFQASKRTLEAIIIHIDEYPMCINRLRSYRNRQWLEARNLFKDMLKEIGEVMRTKSADPNKQFFIIPIYTGTSALDVHFLPTEYNRKMVELKPLNRDAAKSIFFDKYEYSRQSAAGGIKVLQDLQRRYSDVSSDNIFERSLELCELVWEQNHFQTALHDTGFIP